MGLPPFRPDGRLPTGTPCWEGGFVGCVYLGHPTSGEELRDRFVQAYMPSTTRQLLFQELVMLWELAAARLERFGMWVSGDFVVDVRDPRKVFVVLEVPEADLAQLDAADAWLLARMFLDHEFILDENDDGLLLQTAMCRAVPHGHIGYDSALAECMKNREEAGRPHGEPVGGYVELTNMEGGVDQLDLALQRILEATNKPLPEIGRGNTPAP